MELLQSCTESSICGLQSSLLYETHFCKELDCWSLTCSWSIACRRCSNYIFNLDLTPGFTVLREDHCKLRREAFKLWDIVCLFFYIRDFTVVYVRFDGTYTYICTVLVELCIVYSYSLCGHVMNEDEQLWSCDLCCWGYHHICLMVELW